MPNPDANAREGLLFVEDLTPQDPVGVTAAHAERLPLVLLHGFTGNTATWEPFATAFGPGRALLAVELPGHGRSADLRAESVEGAAAAAVAAAEAAVASRPGGAAAHWVGYSMGSRIALRVACDRPEAVASLTLVGATPGIADAEAREARREADAAWASALRDNGLEAFVDAWLAQPLFSSLSRLGPQALIAARGQRMKNDPEGLSAALTAMGTGAMEPMWDRLRSLDIPVLLLTGEADEKFTAIAKTMAATLPQGRHVVIGGAGHPVQSEAPEAMAEAVRRFLDEIDQPGGVRIS